MSEQTYEEVAIDNLSAQIEAVNIAGEVATKASAALAVAFAPLVGTKIQRTDFTFTKKAAGLIEATVTPIIAGRTKVRGCNESHMYSAAVTFKSCVSNTHCAQYAENAVCIGNVDDGVLTKLYTPQVFRSDWTVYEVQRKRLRVQELKIMLDEAQSALFPFGKY